jgi:hypothetical protein
MFSTNPFALLTESIPPLAMQIYAVLMIAAVAFGTVFDVYHKRSAKFFARRRMKSKAATTRTLGMGETAWLAVKTIGVEVATAGEFCKWQRRLSHLLMSYGFVVYLVTTAVMVFAYPWAAHTPIALTAGWTIGALMVLAGGYWFFFLLRVDVAYEKHSPFRLVQADLFIGSLLASVTFGLIWHLAQTQGVSATATFVLFGIYILFSTLLFVSVPWSKFAHMFYKPVVAFQRRLEEADGSSDLPRPAGHSNIRG